MKELYFNLPGFFAQLKTFFVPHGNKIFFSTLVKLKLINFLVNMKYFLFPALATHIKILFALHVCDKKFIAEICICLLIKWKKKTTECYWMCVCVYECGASAVFLFCILNMLRIFVHLKAITQLEIYYKLFFKFHYHCQSLVFFSLGWTKKARFFFLLMDV